MKAPSFALVASISVAIAFVMLGSGVAVAQDITETLEVRADTAQVNGIEIFYREVGSGPPALLLHGFTGVGSWWDPMVEDLSRENTLIIPDLPGHGRSTVRPGPYRLSQVSVDLFALMDKLGIDRFNVIGYSAGGITLLHMATQEPHRIRAMSVVAAAHTLTESNRDRLTNWPSFDDWGEGTREYWFDVHPGGEDQVRTLLEAMRGMAAEGDEMNFTLEELSHIEARTLLVTGDRDWLVPLDLATEMYDAIPDAALWIVPWQGHSPLLPDWGGSPEAKQIFPAIVSKLFQPSETSMP